MDGRLIDEALNHFSSQPYDYFSNVMQRSFPDGLDIEIFTLRALIHTERECKDPWAREHVTPYMRSETKLIEKTGAFKTGHFKAEANFEHLRWTLDTARDYEFLEALTQHKIDASSWQEILSTITKNPELLMWNHGISKRIPNKSSDSKLHTKATTNLSATSHAH